MNKELKMIIFRIIFVVISIAFTFTNAFSQSISDTLETAKTLRNEKKFKAAFALLENYRIHHPQDLNASWLSAQTAYWMNKINTSEVIYEQAIQKHPENYYLKLDYAKMLVNVGAFEKAAPILTTYLQYDSVNSEALLAFAKISFWKSKLKEASQMVEKILLLEPLSKEALGLRDEIRSAKSPWAKVSYTYNTDDQPLKTSTVIFEGGLYGNAFTFLHFDFRVPTFISENSTNNALWFSVGNTSVFSKQKIKLNIELGLLKYPVGNNYEFTGNLQLDKIILNHLVFSVQAERKPYFYTLNSIGKTVIENQFSVSASWLDKDKWNAKMLYSKDYFNDNNSISTFSAWLITPPLKLSIIDFHLGYGYNYSTSDENRFEADKSLDDIVTLTNPRNGISGSYQPYYTPNNQQIHSAIASVGLHFSNKIQFNLKASYGFYATSLSPYLYVDKDESNNDYLVKGFYNNIYSPLEISLGLNFKMSNKVNLNAEVIYNKTDYYKNLYLSLGIKKSF